MPKKTHPHGEPPGLDRHGPPAHARAHGRVIDPDHYGPQPTTPVFTDPGTVDPTAEAGTVRAVVERWVDGDTVDVHVRLDHVGLDALATPRYRLYGVDTPERGDPGYREATARAAELAPEGTVVTLRTVLTDDKYGRVLAEVLTDDGTNVGARLIAEGHARPYTGGTRQPW